MLMWKTGPKLTLKTNHVTSKFYLNTVLKFHKA